MCAVNKAAIPGSDGNRKIARLIDRLDTGTYRWHIVILSLKIKPYRSKLKFEKTRICFRAGAELVTVLC